MDQAYFRHGLYGFGFIQFLHT